MFALGLMETEYRFGGKNPDAGLDCSGMVSYVYRQTTGLRLTGSAADIARKGRRIDTTQLRPGDLVFFNTLHRRHSHVGIYVGNGSFIHAPSSSSGHVRTDSLWRGWFAKRFEEARTYLE
jgi:cell wall-associated NlpC family hydrolase